MVYWLLKSSKIRVNGTLSSSSCTTSSWGNKRRHHSLMIHSGKCRLLIDCLRKSKFNENRHFGRFCATHIKPLFGAIFTYILPPFWSHRNSPGCRVLSSCSSTSHKRVYWIPKNGLYEICACMRGLWIRKQNRLSTNFQQIERKKVRHAFLSRSIFPLGNISKKYFRAPTFRGG